MSFACFRSSLQCRWPVRLCRTSVVPDGPASVADPWSSAIFVLRNASSAQYWRKTLTGLPIAAAPVASTAAAARRSSVPENRTRERVVSSFIVDLRADADVGDRERSGRAPNVMNWEGRSSLFSLYMDMSIYAETDVGG